MSNCPEQGCNYPIPDNEDTAVKTCERCGKKVLLPEPQQPE